LTEAVESIIKQTFTDWELILADDGSTDSGISVAKSYAERHPGRIFYAEHDNHVNKALPATRNLGISKARGEFVAFLDADDVWLPEYLAGQIERLSTDPRISMLCQATCYWYGWNESNPVYEEITVGAKPERLYQPPELVELLYPLGSGAAPCICGIIIKRSVLEEIGGFEESFVGKAQAIEDQAFLSKVYLNYPVYVSSECRNLYRQRPESMMHAVASEGQYEAVRRFYLEWLEGYLLRERRDDPAIWELLRKARQTDRIPLYIKTVTRAKNGLKRLLAKLAG